MSGVEFHVELHFKTQVPKNLNDRFLFETLSWALSQT